VGIVRCAGIGIKMIFSTYLVPDVEMLCARNAINLPEHKPRIARNNSAYLERIQPEKLY